MLHPDSDSQTECFPLLPIWAILVLFSILLLPPPFIRRQPQLQYLLAFL